MMQLDLTSQRSHLKGCSCTKDQHDAIQHDVKEAISQAFKFGILEVKFYQNNLTEIQIKDCQLKLKLFMRIISTCLF